MSVRSMRFQRALCIAVISAPAFAQHFSVTTGALGLADTGVERTDGRGSIVYFAGPRTNAPRFSPDDIGIVAADEVTGVSILDPGTPVWTSSTDRPEYVFFSVAPGSAGVSGEVLIESMTPGEAQSDIFGVRPNQPSLSVKDEQLMGLMANESDNLDALDIYVLPGTPRRLPGPGFAFITLGAGSPTLAAIGATPADVLEVIGNGQGVRVAVSSGELGLVATDVIDALFVGRNGGVFFSLAAGSPTLGLIPALPGDVLGADGFSEDTLDTRPDVVIQGADLGLAAGDDLDALDLTEHIFPPRMVIGASGGRLNTPGVDIEFDAGALGMNREISIDPIEEDLEIDFGSIADGTVTSFVPQSFIEFGPNGLHVPRRGSMGDIVEDFRARVMIAYPDDDNDGIVDGLEIDETTLQGVFTDQSKATRVVISIVDVAANTVTVGVEDLGVFALASVEAEKAPGEGCGAGSSRPEGIAGDLIVGTMLSALLILLPARNLVPTAIRR